MKILVVGNGGRESAICWKIKQSPLCSELYCAPGNGGTSLIAKNISLTKIEDLLNFAKENVIDLTVVGPENPLVNGIVDAFEREGLKIFGPNKNCAQIEGSKIFAKNLMKKYKIPTAEFEEFSDSRTAIDFARAMNFPIVIKADGLAAGKGVVIAKSFIEAESTIKKILDERVFGEAGKKIIIEEYLQGEEASILCFTDGNTILPMESSQDHKRVFDNDEGPNTGGMGAYSPAPCVTQNIMSQVEKQILLPVVKALKEEGCHYKGVLYAGLMITKNGPKVLEFNVRFGDPETQALLPRLKTDLVEVFLAVIEGRLEEIKLLWDEKACVCVVLASKGYPEEYKTGYEILGLENLNNMKDVFVFHAGTSLAGCNFVTSGGRVLGISALGDTIKDAIDRAYFAISKVNFKDMHFRKDIGYRAIKRGFDCNK